MQKITAKNLRDAENEVTVGYFLENIHAEPLPKFHHALLVAGGTEVAALAGECQQVFVAAVLALHTGKTVLQITAIKVTVDHVSDIGPPEAVIPLRNAHHIPARRFQ